MGRCRSQHGGEAEARTAQLLCSAAHMATSNTSIHEKLWKTRPSQHMSFASCCCTHLGVIVRDLLVRHRHNLAAAAAGAVHGGGAGCHPVQTRRRALCLQLPLVPRNQGLVVSTRAARRMVGGGRVGLTRASAAGEAMCGTADQPCCFQRSAVPPHHFSEQWRDPQSATHLKVCVLDPARKAE